MGDFNKKIRLSS